MIGLVINPNSGRGRGSRVAQSFSPRIEGLGWRVVHTAAPREEERIATQLLEEGAETLVAVGGDGTCSNIARAIIAQTRRCSLAVIPAGTGNDFAKTLGVTALSVDDIIQLVGKNRPSLIDVGRSDDNFFLNSCGFGFDAAVLEASNRVRWLRGNAVYMYSAIKQLFTYSGVDVAVGDVNNALSRMLMVTVSNGQWLGGAFHIAPDASATDGQLDVALIGNSGVVERALLFLSATRGTHIRRSSVQQIRSSKVTLNFSSPPAMEIDGELRYAKSSTVVVECIPRALSVIAAAGAVGT